MLKKYTTGEYYEERLNSVKWLEKNNESLEFKNKITLSDIQRFEVIKNNQVIIEVQIDEEMKTYKNGVVRKEEKFLNTKQFLLELEKGNWKISKGLGVEGK